MVSRNGKDSVGKAACLFVYGTLKREGSAHSVIEPHVDFIGEGSVIGRLYRLDGYPGLVLGGGAKSRVWGELYRIRRTAPLFALLDAYEECSQRDPRPHPYRRILAPVTLRGGGRVTAWLYEYIGSVKGRRVIPSGRWEG